MQAMGWLEGATNTQTKRDILAQLDGSTHAAMKAPLLGMLSKEASGRVREELVDVLADFPADPAVEKKMWELALNDPEENVRDEAAKALTKGKMTPRTDRLANGARIEHAALPG